VDGSCADRAERRGGDGGGGGEKGKGGRATHQTAAGRWQQLIGRLGRRMGAGAERAGFRGGAITCNAVEGNGDFLIGTNLHICSWRKALEQLVKIQQKRNHKIERILLTLRMDRRRVRGGEGVIPNAGWPGGGPRDEKDLQRSQVGVK